MKIKAFCSSKDDVKKRKRQGTDRKKILLVQISDRGLVFSTYKEFLKS